MMIKNPGKIKIKRYRRLNPPGKYGLHQSLLTAHEYIRLHENDEEDEYEADDEEYEDSEEDTDAMAELELAGEIW